MAMTPDTREYRNFQITEFRAEGENSYQIEGYAAKFESETVLYKIDGIEYKEVIDRNAFTGAEMSNVVLNYNHSGKPVARTRNNTLTLTVDTVGLKVNADLGGTEEGRRLFEEIKGGYLDQMSFAFIVNRSEYDKTNHLRRITGIKQVFDVAVVDFPAYNATEVAARSWAKAEAELEKRNAAKEKLLLKIKLAKGD